MNATPKNQNSVCGDIKTVTYNPRDDLPEDTVYEKVIKLCAQNNLTIKELAGKAGVKYNTLRGYKNRVKDYCPITLHKIAAVFGYDVRYFMKFDLTKISGRIKYYRSINGYGMSNLAKMIEVHRDTIKTWEFDQFKPSEENIKKLVLLFGENFLMPD